MPRSLIFTRNFDYWFRSTMIGCFLAAILALAGLYYYGPQDYTRVGYSPPQPVPFSHAQHVGQLGLSCLYCHTGVEESPVAKIPPTQTCMNCHSAIKADSPKLALVKASFETGKPIPWVRVHKTPDYVFFNHSAHVRRGVGCVSCHGRINEMPVVIHAKSLSMGWCLDCHRHPETQLRPLAEVTNLNWRPSEGRNQQELGVDLKDQSKIHAPEQCVGCHR
ncbi:MAG: cytochrome c3 family protein [Isosphaeraceae bacterium]